MYPHQKWNMIISKANPRIVESTSQINFILTSYEHMRLQEMEYVSIIKISQDPVELN